ncbi:TPA: crossover junction endodeoxyribonuclease RuvC [Candidatus Gracilibacteria bacterium]|nr:crossover junction endodeoxyribonuclease RuvC [Candidatus Peregrinibacteria bacterium]HIQ56912.1 crossover junction endodeoxyribonuclease RuvC [Candidatus Gracilibacteria bacterium]HIQ57319.1 crossover junction endodeoxyribonuclease RuvC [Candidatus Gracilibacteria bacterium]
MIILGIDPGYDRCGFALLSKNISTSEFEVLDFGVITTNKNDIFQDRLCDLGNDISDIINKYSPTILAIEKMFWGANVNNAIRVAEARGVIEFLCRKSGCEIVEYAPTEIKSKLVGHGRAEKFQVQNVLQMRLGLQNIPQPDDAADALAIALLASEEMQN